MTAVHCMSVYIYIYIYACSVYNQTLLILLTHSAAYVHSASEPIMVQSGTMSELPTGHPEMPGHHVAAHSTVDDTKVCQFWYCLI